MIDMALFTGAYTNPLAVSPDTTIQAAMDATQLTLSSGGSPNVNNLAMTVVIITGSEGTFDHPWAGLRANETHYAASLVKIASMYAAFDMRSSADILVTDQGLTSWPDIEAALVADFNPEIDTNTPTGISGSPLLRPEDKTRKPNYAGMLQPGSGGVFAVDFTSAQLAAFEDFVVEQHDAGAGTTIHNLGYPYLNGKIADDGFFDGTDGIWLAGDYVHTWPAARIACVNDVDTAQGTTTCQFASLMTLMADDVLVGPASSQEMKGLMGRAGDVLPRHDATTVARRRPVHAAGRKGRHRTPEIGQDRVLGGDQGRRYLPRPGVCGCVGERRAGRPDRSTALRACSPAHRGRRHRVRALTHEMYGGRVTTCAAECLCRGSRSHAPAREALRSSGHVYLPHQLPRTSVPSGTTPPSSAESRASTAEGRVVRAWSPRVNPREPPTTLLLFVGEIRSAVRMNGGPRRKEFIRIARKVGRYG